MAWLFSLGLYSVIGIDTVLFTLCKYKIHERTSTKMLYKYYANLELSKFPIGSVDEGN